MSKDSSLEWVEYTRVNAEVTKAKERVVTEFGLSISVNGRHLATPMITPMMEREFVVGYLFGQGIIEGTADIEAITLKGDKAEVSLSKKAGGAKKPAKIGFDFKVSREDIFKGVSAILKSDIYAETGGIHSAGLFKKGTEPLCIAEDIGRHNALDKIIGYGLLNNVDFASTFAASTGRQPAEMILRYRNTNIPIIATKGVPTSLAINIAASAGITIAGMVRGNTMIVYSNPSRIV